MVHNPCLLLLLQLLLRIEAAKRGKEKERLTWSGYLKTKTMVMEGWLTHVTFFPSTSVFRSLHLCSCFSLLVFSLLFFFSFSLVPSVSLCSCSSWSLSVLSVFVHFVCVFFALPVCGLPFFAAFLCSSWFLWVCIWLVGSSTYGEGKLKFPLAGGRPQVSLSSLCLCFSPLSCLRKKNAHYWTVRGTLWRRDTG